MDQAQLENLEKKLGSLETEVFKLRSELERAKRGAGAPMQTAVPAPTKPVAAPVQAVATPVAAPSAAPNKSSPATQSSEGDSFS